MRRGVLLVLLPFAAIAIAGANGACSSLDDLVNGDDDPAAPPSRSDAGGGDACGANIDSDPNNCGACGAVCAEDQYCLRGACAIGCRDRAVYVSIDGNDGASGCSPRNPKRTIGGAIARVKAVAAEGHEIRICRGTYQETGLVLDHRVALRGDYECSTWTQATSGGWPTYSQTNEVVIENTNPATPTLLVRGPTMNDLLIERLTIRGGTGAIGGNIALQVLDEAKPHVVGSTMQGGGGLHSRGLYAGAGGAPWIDKSRVNGGIGTSSTAAVEIAATGGGRFTDDLINGQGVPGTVTAPSSGITAVDANPITIERSVILGGNGGSSSASVPVASVGVILTRTSADISDSGLAGGTPTCAATCSSVALEVYAGEKAKLRVFRNRIYGGDTVASVPLPAMERSFNVGIRITSAKNMEIFANDLLAGNKNSGTTDLTEGMLIYKSEGTQIVGNTMLSGRTAFATNNLEPSVHLLESSGTVLRNNLFAAMAPATGRRSTLYLQCVDAAPAFAEFRNNAFLTTPGTDVAVKFCPGTPSTNATTADAIPALVPGAVDNLVSPIELTTVIEGYTSPLSAFDIMSGGHFKLKADTLCAISRGGTGNPVPPFDAFNLPRTVPFSIGAHEQDAAGCTP